MLQDIWSDIVGRIVFFGFGLGVAICGLLVPTTTWQALERGFAKAEK